jgi:hypothetical protein
VEVTVASLINDLEEDRKLARELGQASAAVAANTLKAKLAGRLVERGRRWTSPCRQRLLALADEVIE